MYTMAEINVQPCNVKPTEYHLAVVSPELKALSIDKRICEQLLASHSPAYYLEQYFLTHLCQMLLIVFDKNSNGCVIAENLGFSGYCKLLVQGM